MAARFATSAAKRCLPMLPSLYGQRVRSSNCFWGPRIGTLIQQTSREWESRKVGPTRIYGAAPTWKKLVPLGYLIENEEIGVLLSFDFSTETLSSIPGPPIQNGWSCVIFLEYKGFFGYVPCWKDENEIPVRFELWVMKNGSWTMESVFHTCGVSRPLWFSRNGELLYFSSLNEEVLVFDRVTGKLNHPGINFGWPGTWLTPFVENFVQLNGISHAEAEDLEKEEGGEEEYIIEAPEGPLMQA
ncbi:uncharacterized protein LOC131023887 isoform X3 [Salvia miltiorrhiza]|nr:uncharacterized protein LOC131023887 isoform X3 [Salvia miltiorrhiza]XP_057809509.1 uncharacterized protein LOC131023887 isoform X3 [Salvia miltiorrhiza]